MSSSSFHVNPGQEDQETLLTCMKELCLEKEEFQCSLAELVQHVKKKIGSHVTKQDVNRALYASSKTGLTKKVKDTPPLWKFEVPPPKKEKEEKALPLPFQSDEDLKWSLNAALGFRTSIVFVDPDTISSAEIQKLKDQIKDKALCLIIGDAREELSNQCMMNPPTKESGCLVWSSCPRKVRTFKYAMHENVFHQVKRSLFHEHTPLKRFIFLNLDSAVLACYLFGLYRGPPHPSSIRLHQTGSVAECVQWILDE